MYLASALAVWLLHAKPPQLCEHGVGACVGICVGGVGEWVGNAVGERVSPGLVGDGVVGGVGDRLLGSGVGDSVAPSLVGDSVGLPGGILGVGLDVGSGKNRSSRPALNVMGILLC